MHQWRRFPDYPRMHQLVVDGEPIEVFVEQGQVTRTPTSNVRDALELELRNFGPGATSPRSQAAFAAKRLYPSLQTHLDKLGTLASEPPSGVPEHLAEKLSATGDVGSAALLGQPYEATTIIANGSAPYPSVDKLRATEFDRANLFVSERGLEIVASKAPEKQRASKFFRRLDKVSSALDPFSVLDLASDRLISAVSKEQRSLNAYNAIVEAAQQSNRTITYFVAWKYQREFRVISSPDGSCMLMMLAMADPGSGCSPFGLLTTIAFRPGVRASEVATIVGQRALASRQMGEPDADTSEFTTALSACREAIDGSPSTVFRVRLPGTPVMIQPHTFG